MLENSVTSCSGRGSFIVTEGFNFPQSCCAEELTCGYNDQQRSVAKRITALTQAGMAASEFSTAQLSKNSLVPDLMENVARKLGSDVPLADVMWQQ